MFADQARKALTHDYRQTAWVGQLEIEAGTSGILRNILAERVLGLPRSR